MNAQYVDPEVIRAAHFVQSEATRGGIVAEFVRK